MKGFKDILTEKKLNVKLPSNISINIKKRIENFSKKISNEDGKNYNRERLLKFLNSNEIYKYEIVTKNDSNTSKGIDFDVLEKEFDILGYRYIISRTAGVNRVNFERKL